MSMSKKDFIDIAVDLRIERNNLKRQNEDDQCGMHIRGFDIAVQALLGPFKRANSAFDKERFLDAVMKP